MSEYKNVKIEKLRYWVVLIDDNRPLYYFEVRVTTYYGSGLIYYKQQIGQSFNSVLFVTKVFEDIYYNGGMQYEEALLKTFGDNYVAMITWLEPLYDKIMEADNIYIRLEDLED